jgi:SPP1 family predicted phage head-tail adaptor
MTTGSLDRRLLIERKVVTKDPDFGSEVVAWAEFATVWGSAVDVLRPKEESTASGIRLLMRPCAVEIRYRAGITTDMRITIIERGRLLQIVSIAEVERRRFLSLMCEEFSV